VSDIDTVAVDSLKALDPQWPIREADMREPPVMAVSLLQAAVLAPLVPLADALSLAHARPRQNTGGFEYGWIRGVGSAAFVAGTLLAGQAAGDYGLSAIIWLSATALLATPVAALAALAQDNRLDVFRLLVEAGLKGMPAGEIASALKLAPNTLTFHFDRLRMAGLVSVRRDGRSMIYAARFETMNALEGRAHRGNAAVGGRR